MTDPKHYTVQEYGCVACQKYHAEGEPLFLEHIFRQSKHGIRQRVQCVEDDLAAAVERAQKQD